MRTRLVVLLLILLGYTSAAISMAYQVQAQLSLEAPPPPNLVIDGNVTDLTADDKDRDIAIDPLDELPANGSVSISTSLATDVDINEFPPEGVTVLIQNDSITVTNQTVTIGPVPTAAAFSTGDGGNGNGDGDGDGGDGDEE